MERVQNEPATPLSSRPTQPVALPQHGPASGVRLGKEPGLPVGVGPPGPWGCTALCACWLLPWTHLCTEGNRGLAGMDVGVSPAACAQRTRHWAPSFALSPAWVLWAARAGRASQRREHSSPCADQPRRAPAAPGPSLSAPLFRGAILAGVALCRHRWSLAVALSEACLRARVSLSEQPAGVPGCPGAGDTDPCTGACVVSCLKPADGRHPLRTRRLLWLREGDQLSWLVTQLGVRGAQLEGPARRTAGLWPHPCPLDLAPSPAQLTRPAVW